MTLYYHGPESCFSAANMHGPPSVLAPVLRNRVSGFAGARISRRCRLARVLTLACFFHFSGLNNGFSFFAVPPGQIHAFSFAPLAIRSVALAFNPFAWKRAADRGLIFKLFSSARVLEVCSQRALQGMIGQWELIKTGSRFAVGSGSLSPLESNGQRVAPVSLPLSAGARQLAPATRQPRADSWLKLERLEILDQDHGLEDFDQPSWGWKGSQGKGSNLDRGLRAGSLFLHQAARPRLRRRIHYDSAEDSQAPLLDRRGQLQKIGPPFRRTGFFILGSVFLPCEEGKDLIHASVKKVK